MALDFSTCPASITRIGILNDIALTPAPFNFVLIIVFSPVVKVIVRQRLIFCNFALVALPLPPSLAIIYMILSKTGVSCRLVSSRANARSLQIAACISICDNELFAGTNKFLGSPINDIATCSPNVFPLLECPQWSTIKDCTLNSFSKVTAKTPSHLNRTVSSLITGSIALIHSLSEPFVSYFSVSCIDLIDLTPSLLIILLPIIKVSSLRQPYLLAIIVNGKVLALSLIHLLKYLHRLLIWVSIRLI